MEARITAVTLLALFALLFAVFAVSALEPDNPTMSRQQIETAARNYQNQEPTP